MPVSTTITVVGLKETINALNKVEPQLVKDFKASANKIAQPAISAAQNAYTQVPLSGMARAWKSHKRTPPQNVKGFSVANAVRGVQTKFDTRRKAVGVILIIQKDQAAAIFETAGRANPNRLSNNLEPVSAGRTRLIGPAVYRSRRKIENEMKEMIVDTISAVQKKI
jgi:hypothetical protein